MDEQSYRHVSDCQSVLTVNYSTNACVYIRYIVCRKDIGNVFRPSGDHGRTRLMRIKGFGCIITKFNHIISEASARPFGSRTFVQCFHIFYDRGGKPVHTRRAPVTRDDAFFSRPHLRSRKPRCRLTHKMCVCMGVHVISEYRIYGPLRHQFFISKPSFCETNIEIRCLKQSLHQTSLK